MEKTHFNILLIEDDPEDVFFINELISDITLYSYSIIHVTKISQISNAIKGQAIDVILSDLGLPDSTGINTVSKVLALAPKIPIIVLTGLNDEKAGNDAIIAGAQDYIIKGQNSSSLLAKSINFAYKRQQIKNQLNKSQSRFKGIVENMDGGIVLIEDKKVIYVNPQFEKISGYTLQTLKADLEKKDNANSHIINIIHNINNDDRFVEDKELWITNRHGKSYYVHCKVTLDVYQKTSKCIICTDKTDSWKNLEMNRFTNHLINANIFEAREEYFKILHSMLAQKFNDKTISLGLIEKNTVDFLTYNNNKVQRASLPITKCPCLTIIKKQENFILNKARIEKAVARDGIEFPFEKPVSFLGIGLKNKNKYVGVITINDHNNDNAFNEKDLEWLELIAKQTSYVIQKNKQDEKIKQLSTSIEQSQTCIVVTNIQGNIEYVNPFFEQLTGYTEEEVINKNPRILQSGLTPKETYKELWETVINGSTWKGTFINKKKNGDLYYEDASITGVKNEKNQITHYVAVKTDITKRIKKEKELERVKIKAEESDKLKSMFLTNLSHEIRTPLNGILGFSKLLKKPNVTSEATERYIKIIEESGKALISTVHNILDLSSIQSQQIGVNKSSFAINDFLINIYKEYEYQFERKGIKWVLNNQTKKEDPHITTDKDLLHKSITHLINNALKFTDNGQVKLNTNFNQDYLCINIIDTGIGIPESSKNKIFDCFVQADMKENRVHQGPGIGLSIAKGLLNILGGELTFESKENQGSTFTIKLSNSIFEVISSAQANPLNKIIETNPSNVKILIVEDDDVSSIYLETLLKILHFETITAKNGLEAYDIFLENRDISIIIMDINLPGQSGLKTTAQIREIDKDVLIFAQTAYTDDFNMKKANEVGCNEFMTKPIVQEDLEEVINKYFQFKEVQKV
jgi:PAS domain S-box-containing protein